MLPRQSLKLKNITELVNMSGMKLLKKMLKKKMLNINTNEGLALVLWLVYCSFVVVFVAYLHPLNFKSLKKWFQIYITFWLNVQNLEV